jgi:hypothetical protein
MRGVLGMVWGLRGPLSSVAPICDRPFLGEGHSHWAPLSHLRRRLAYGSMTYGGSSGRGGSWWSATQAPPTPTATAQQGTQEAQAQGATQGTQPRDFSGPFHDLIYLLRPFLCVDGMHAMGGEARETWP